MEEAAEETVVAFFGSVDKNDGLILLSDLPKNLTLQEIQSAFDLLFGEDGVIGGDDNVFMPPFILSTVSQIERVFPEGRRCDHFKVIVLSLRKWAKNNRKLFCDDKQFNFLVGMTINRIDMERGIREALPGTFFGRSEDDSGELVRLLGKLVDSGMVSREQFSGFKRFARERPFDVINLLVDMVLTTARLEEES